MKPKYNETEHKPTQRNLLNTKQAGDLVCLSERTLQGMRQKGGGPKFIRISSRCVRYREYDLVEWINGRIQSSTTEGKI